MESCSLVLTQKFWVKKCGESCFHWFCRKIKGHWRKWRKSAAIYFTFASLVLNVENNSNSTIWKTFCFENVFRFVWKWKDRGNDKKLEGKNRNSREQLLKHVFSLFIKTGRHSNSLYASTGGERVYWVVVTSHDLNLLGSRIKDSMQDSKCGMWKQLFEPRALNLPWIQ